MTGAEEVLREGQNQEPQAEVCEASLEAARGLTGVFLGELSNAGSVLYDVISTRAAGMPDTERLGLVPALQVDPSRSRVVVERWRQQTGALPEDASTNDPDAMLTLWVAKKKDIPPLRVPEGGDTRVMNLADRLGMRGVASMEDGARPVIFERAEAAQVPVGPETLINISGAANFANRERIKTALALTEAHDCDKPLVATVDPLRMLRPPEREKVAEFAPHATNELELFIASALAEGFTPSEDNLHGSTFLPDGSSYIKMHHPNGADMIVLAPIKNQREDGTDQSGLHNAYKTLLLHGAAIPGLNTDDQALQLAESDIVYVTSTHYGPMGIMNNLHATHELRTTVGSFRVIGDNQPARTAQAHLVEVGHTIRSIEEASTIPALREGLLGSAEES